MISDAATVKNVLIQWSKDGKLQDATVTKESVTLGEQSLDMATKIDVEFQEKSVSYSLGSVFLQILDPSQSLMKYRKACKEYGVPDGVKASEKPTVVGFFLGIDSSTAAPPPPPPKTAAAAAPPPPPKPSDSTSRRHKHDKRKRSKPTPEAPPKKKRAPGLVSTEQLFENLTEVVGKRQSSEVALAITKALSAEGFAVTKQMLDASKDRNARILAQEIPVGNSASILRANNPRKDLSRVLEIFNESIGKTKRATPSPKKPTKKTYLIGKRPIIIVPKGMTAPLTLINAHEFLCNATFTTRSAMISQGRRTPPTTTFTRTLTGGGLLEYEILDNPRKLDAREWERVVAVIALGQSWQFKDWMPPYNVPATLFDKVYGFFVSLEGDRLPAEVPGWAVRRAVLNRDKRGLDSVTFASFWNGLDEWMRVYKAELLPQVDE